jgi:hypothetical protein
VFSIASILYLKRGALFRPTLPLIINPCRRDIRVPQPLLHLGDVGMMREGVRRRGRAQRVYTEPMHVDGDAYRCAVVFDHLVIHGFGIQRFAELAGRIILHRPKQRSLQVLPMLGGFEIVMNQPLRLRRHRDEAHLVAFTLNPKVQDAFAPLIITHAELTEFFASDAVKEEGGENRPVADAFARVRRRSLEELARLRIAERRRGAFVVVRFWPFHAFDGIMGYRISLTEILKKGGQRRELAADGRRRQLSALDVLAPGDDVGAGDEPEFFRAVDADEGAEVGNVQVVGAAGFLVGDVGEPLELGGDLGQPLELGSGQRSRCWDETCRNMGRRHGSPLDFRGGILPPIKYIIGGKEGRKNLLATRVTSSEFILKNIKLSFLIFLVYYSPKIVLFILSTCNPCYSRVLETDE